MDKGCICDNVSIPRGGRAEPFIDFIDEILKISTDKQYLIVGDGNWTLILAGVLTWDQVVTRGRVRELAEVLDRYRITRELLEGSGITGPEAEEALAIAWPPETLAKIATRKEAYDRLRSLGLTHHEIVQGMADRLKGRIGLAAGLPAPKFVQHHL